VIGINVSANIDAVLRDVELSHRELQVAVMRSLNRTADGIKTDAGREIRKVYNVTLKALNGSNRRLGAFDIRYATLATMAARVTASGHPLPLYGFDPKETKAGVTVAIKRGRGSRKLLRHAFIARMKSGHVGVFMRRGKKGEKMAGRLKIDEKYTNAVPGMLRAITKGVDSALKQMALDRFDKAMAQNVRFVRSGR
jgi:hypothetical protein